MLYYDDSASSVCEITLLD